MDTTYWIALGTLTLLLAEGFTLTVFPQQVQELLREAEPSWLQTAGLAETCVGAVLMMLLWLG